MALRFLDSFAHYASGDLTDKWSASIGTPAINATGSRRGGPCLFINAQTEYISLSLDGQATWIIGFAFKYTNLPNGDTYLVGLYDAGTAQVNLILESTGHLGVYRSTTTLLGRTSIALAQGVWYYVEWKCTIHDTTGSTEVKIDGASQLSLTSQDTKATTNTTANQIILGCRGSIGTHGRYFHDLYLCDGSGSVNNDFLGDLRIDCLTPNADGSNSQFTPSTGSVHYALIDEANPNDDTDYLSDGTAGHRDSWNFTNLSALTSPVLKGVQLALADKKDDAGTRAVKVLVKSGATTNTKASDYLQSSYRYALGIWETDPNTGAAWTETNLNSAEFGVENV